MTGPERPCPVCGGDGQQAIHRQEFVFPSGIGLPTAYEVVVCRTCGAAFAAVAASQQDYDRYYTDLSPYASAGTSTGSGLSPSDRIRVEESARIIAALAPPGGGRVLDIGCGLGGLVLALRRLGLADVAGIDPSPDCVAALAAEGVESHCGTLGLLPPCAEADVVVMTGVLEHLRDVDPCLTAALGRLKPAGVLFVEVPDAERYADCLWCPFQDFNAEHINHFSLGSLRNLFARHGLTVVGEGRREVGASARDPALWVAARRSLAVPPLVRDQALAPALDAYVRRSRAAMERISCYLERTLPGHPVWNVWGAGQFLYRLLAGTALGRFPLGCVVDGNPVLHGRTIAGAPIVPPAAARPVGPVLITSLQHQRAIAAAIARDFPASAWAVSLPPLEPAA